MARVTVPDLLFACAVVFTLVNVYISFGNSASERYYASVEELTRHNEFFSIGVKSYGAVENKEALLNEGGDLEDDGDGGEIRESVEDSGIAGKMKGEFDELYEPAEPDDPEAEFGENEDYDILDLDQDVDDTQHGPDVDMMMGDDAVSMRVLKKLRKDSRQKKPAVAQPEIAAKKPHVAAQQSDTVVNRPKVAVIQPIIAAKPEGENVVQAKVAAVSNQDTKPRQFADQTNTTTTKESTGNRKADNKPTLVLYVGPRGMVTSLLQKYLLRHLESKLLLDGWAKLSFKFTKMLELISKCFEKNESCSLWSEFVQQCNSTLSTGKNLLYISETLSKIPSNNHTIHIMKELQHHWDVRILLAYRPLYDWFPALYAQERKKYVYDSKTQEYKSLSNRKTLKSDLKSIASYFDNQFRRKPTDSLAVWELYTQIYGKENVFVFDGTNIADPRAIVLDFVVQGLPEAEQTLLALKTETLPVLDDDKEFSFSQSFPGLLDHDLLIYHALEMGSILQPESTTVETLLSAIDRKLQKLGVSSIADVEPRILISEDSKFWLWNRTTTSETNLRPPGSRKQPEKLLAEWGQAVSAKFSSIDAKAVLASQDWESIFSAVG